MKKATPKVPWIEANQAYLVVEFARLKQRIGSQPAADLEDAIEKARAAMEAPPAIDRLSDLFELSTFEREILLLCAGAEMDSGLASKCGEAQGYPQRVYATFGLAMAMLAEPHWSALTPSRPLRRFRLLEVGDRPGPHFRTPSASTSASCTIWPE